MVLLVMLLMLGINTVSLRAEEQPPLPQAQTQKEAFVVKKLQEFIEARVLSSQVKKQREQISKDVSLAIGYMTALGIIASAGVVQWPPSSFLRLFGESFLVYWGTSFLGENIGSLCKPVVNFFVNELYPLSEQGDDDYGNCHHRALTAFVRNWNEFKQYTPQLLHAQFDALYVEYLEAGGRLKINNADAMQVIKHVVACCIEQQNQKLAEAVA